MLRHIHVAYSVSNFMPISFALLQLCRLASHVALRCSEAQNSGSGYALMPDVHVLDVEEDLLPPIT